MSKWARLFSIDKWMVEKLKQSIKQNPPNDQRPFQALQNPLLASFHWVEITIPAKSVGKVPRQMSAAPPRPAPSPPSCALSPVNVDINLEKKNKQPAKKQAKKNLDNSSKIALFQESFASKNSYSPAKMATGQIFTFLVPIIIITILQQLRSFPTQLSNNFLLAVVPF